MLFLFLESVNNFLYAFVVLHLRLWHNFLYIFQHRRKFFIDLGLRQLLTFLDQLSYFRGKDVSLDGMSKAFMAEKLLSWMEFISNWVVLLNDLSFWSLVAQIYLAFEEVFLTFSLELDQDQSSDCIDHVTVDLEL